MSVVVPKKISQSSGDNYSRNSSRRATKTRVNSSMVSPYSSAISVKVSSSCTRYGLSGSRAALMCPKALPMPALATSQCFRLSGKLSHHSLFSPYDAMASSSNVLQTVLLPLTYPNDSSRRALVQKTTTRSLFSLHRRYHFGGRRCGVYRCQSLF